MVDLENRSKYFKRLFYTFEKAGKDLKGLQLRSVMKNPPHLSNQLAMSLRRGVEGPRIGSADCQVTCRTMSSPLALGLLTLQVEIPSSLAASPTERERL